MLQNLSKNQLELIPLIESCPNLVSFYSNYQLCDCYNVRFSWEVLKALFIHCKSLKYLALPSFAHLTSGKLRMVLRNLPQLKRLVTSTKFTDEQVAIVLKHCPQLEQITFRYCDKTLTQEGLRAFAKQKNQLKKINFNRSAQILTKEILKELLKNSPFLEEIYLDARDWNDEQFKGLAHLPSTLKTLSLESSPYATDAGFEDFPYLPELRHLRIHHGYCGFRLTDATISRLAERCPNLRLLELSGLEGAQDVAETHISENALIQCISKYPDLQYLDLSNMGFLSDNLLKTISEKLPKLRFLNILGSGWFTKQGLGYLKECKNLRYLNINRMRFSDNFVPTEEYVRALIPQLKLLLLTDKDPRHFPDSALIEAGLPPMSDE